MNPVSRSPHPSPATVRLAPSPRHSLRRHARLLLGMTLLFVILWQWPSLINVAH